MKREKNAAKKSTQRWERFFCCFKENLLIITTLRLPFSSLLIFPQIRTQHRIFFLSHFFVLHNCRHISQWKQIIVQKFNKRSAFFIPHTHTHSERARVSAKEQLLENFWGEEKIFAYSSPRANKDKARVLCLSWRLISSFSFPSHRRTQKKCDDDFNKNLSSWKISTQINFYNMKNSHDSIVCERRRYGKKCDNFEMQKDVVWNV